MNQVNVIEQCYFEYSNAASPMDNKEWVSLSNEFDKVLAELEQDLPEEKLELVNRLIELNADILANQLNEFYQEGFKTGAKLIMDIGK